MICMLTNLKITVVKVKREMQFQAVLLVINCRARINSLRMEYLLKYQWDSLTNRKLLLGTQAQEVMHKSPSKRKNF
jgi:hypothetical protein